MPERSKDPTALSSSTSHLTDDHEDEDEGGHSRTDVEHDSDVGRQLLHIIHIGHEDGWEQEAHGDSQLSVRGTKHLFWLNNSPPLADKATLHEGSPQSFL